MNYIISNIPRQFKINDNRKYNDFNTKTFSGYLKKEVLSAFKKALMNGLIETSCYWSIELLCSGLIDKIYEIFLELSSKYINISNPKLPYKLYRRYNNYLDLVKYYEESVKNNDKNNKKNLLLLLRNNQQIRNHICELCYIICNSHKNKPLSLTSINKNYYTSEYIKNYINIDERNIDYYNYNFYKNNDPEQIIIILGAFQNFIRHNNYSKAIYILSWILGYEKLLLKNNVKIICAKRDIVNVDSKFNNDIIWIFWEIILKEAGSMEQIRKIQVDALYILYKYQYNTNKKYKRLPFLLNSIKYITEFYNINLPCIINYPIYIKVNSNINNLFHQIRKHEKTIIENKKETKPEKKNKSKLDPNSIIKINKLDEIDTLIINKSLNTKTIKLDSIIN